MTIHQIRSADGTGTLSYVVLDEATASAILIDPNREDLEKITLLLRSSRVRLTHIFDTHTHADHISGAGEMRELFGAATVMHENTKNKWKIVDQGDAFGIGDTLRANAKIPIDMYVHDGDVIESGTMAVRVIFTPGHTDNQITLHIGDNLFTGDLLLIGQAGRSDLPGGNPEEQYDSLMQKILPLPDQTKIYPGHDYEDHTFAYLGDEKRTNPFLQPRTKAEYVRFVQEFFPPLAEEAGGKMTLQCGVQRVPQPTDQFKTISADELHQLLATTPKVFLLDVREPIELMATGAIEGVRNISVRHLHDRLEELPSEKSMPIVCVCASGNRSMEAAHLLQQNGYTNVFNLKGGTLQWMQRGYPIVRTLVKA
ncbi:MAG: hypothetical protein C4326_06360 [Ignavibacteria bacterium]